MRTGKHIATVVGTSMGESRKGTPYVEARFMVGEELINGKIFLTPRAMGVARKSLQAMGLDIDAVGLSALDLDPKMLDGNTCEIDVEEEEYNNKLYSKVKWINAIKNKPTSKTLDALTKSLRDVKKAETIDNETGAEPIEKNEAEELPF